MAGFRAKNLGRFLKWSLIFLSAKEKRELIFKYKDYRLTKKCKKKAAISRLLRKKIYVENRNFASRKSRLARRLARSSAFLIRKVRDSKIKNLNLKRAFALRSSKKQTIAKDKIRKLEALEESCFLAKKKFTTFLRKAKKGGAIYSSKIKSEIAKMKERGLSLQRKLREARSLIAKKRRSGGIKAREFKFMLKKRASLGKALNIKNF